MNFYAYVAYFIVLFGFCALLGIERQLGSIAKSLREIARNNWRDEKGGK
jgi:hypothetical protein